MILTIEEVWIPPILEMIIGMITVQELPVRTNLIDQVQGQSVLAYIHTCNKMRQPAQYLIADG